MKFYFFYFPAEVIRVIGNIAVRQQQATQLCLGRQPPLHWNDSWIVSTGLARKQRNFKRRKDKTKRKEGVGEGNNHWERNVLSTGAPANCLAHEFVGRVSRLLDLDPALPPQGCWHLSSPDDSSVWHGLFFFFLSFQPLQLSSPRGFPPIRSGLAMMDWHPVSVKLLYGSLMRRSGTGSLNCYCLYWCLNRKSKQVKFHYSCCC